MCGPKNAHGAKLPPNQASNDFLEAERRQLKTYLSLKRLWELALVVLLAPIWLPILLLIALLVYVDLGSPVLFLQERVGLRGKPFKVIKFRTMRGSPREGLQASQEQDRITPLGRFLRRHRLDELPQLWNVIKGEMSLVGPRPEQKVLVDKFTKEIPFYPLRHLVPPGLTGWAQIHCGYMEGMEGAQQKLAYDLYYVEKISFSLDVYILWRTFWVMLTGFGAK